TDGYKASHHKMYPEGTEIVFSNFTPRGVKYMPEQAKEIVMFGIQYTIKYINDLFNENFFFTELRNSPLADDKKKLEELKNNVCGEFKKHLDSYLGVYYDISNFEQLWDLGYLPLEIRGLDEGTIIEPKIP